MNKPAMRTAMVIVSHYNARPTDDLMGLLDQLRSVPSSYPFELGIVVNQAEQKILELPARHSDVGILYRENVGYNIGAWDHGWRQFSRHHFYLFLQEECQIRRPGWLLAYVSALSRRGVGLVGESANWETTWERLEQRYQARALVEPGLAIAGVPPQVFFHTLRRFFAECRIERGRDGDHLQSLVLATRREVLEAIGGFPTGRTPPEAVASEIGISKRVQSMGLLAQQIGLRPFQYVNHPQWARLRKDSYSLRWLARRAVVRWFPFAVREVLYKVLRRG